MSRSVFSCRSQWRWLLSMARSQTARDMEWLVVWFSRVVLGTIEWHHRSLSSRFGFLEGRVDLPRPEGRGLASSPNSSSWSTLRTSPSVKSTESESVVVSVVEIIKIVEVARESKGTRIGQGNYIGVGYWMVLEGLMKKTGEVRHIKKIQEAFVWKPLTFFDSERYVCKMLVTGNFTNVKDSGWRIFGEIDTEWIDE
nr:hypothetical protein [Tanacetum cinerariifolium]